LSSSIADYQLLEPLDPGTGGHPRHVAAPPPRLGIGSDPVILTEFGSDLAWWPAALEQLTRTASVHSEHLGQLLEAGTDEDGLAYVVARYGAAGTLGRPSEPLTPRSAAQAVVAAARAAQALHEAGIAHGAIGPATILLDGPAALLDPPVPPRPGLVAAPVRPQDVELLDPWVLRGGTPCRASDIWSLGATLYRVLVGRPLFPNIEKDVPATAVQRVSRGAPVVADEAAGEIIAIVRSCLEPDPASRPASAEDLAARLEKALGELP
jgi:serine/threonine protein kinase